MNPAKLKQYFWFLFSVMGIVFFWVGIWDGLGSLAYVKEWWISLLIGLTLFAISGIILKENNIFGGAANPVMKILHTIPSHPEKHLFHIKYFDKIKKREKTLTGHQVIGIEKDYFIFLDGNYEQFIPAHRITEILHKGKTHWKQ